MGLFSGALDVISVGLNAYSQWKAGQDAKDVYQYNEELARYQAQYIKDAAEIELVQLERDVDSFVSRRRAITGKSGTVVDKGSSKDVIDVTRRHQDIDAGIIRWKTGRLAQMAEKGANLLSTQADQFGKAGNINALTTLLGGASRWLR